ncbi:MAG: PBP1A family penicillin-binding protein [Deltaproteobacteria bacterium]|nr:PBP1A family penicillin-binding protein [Deltaproteobacteria bacterium]
MKFLRRFLKFTLIGFVCSILLTLGVVLYLTQDLPPLSALKNYRPPIVTEIYSSDGVKIGELYKQKRYVIPFEKIPKLVIHAFIAAEDDRFFEHKGLDFPGIFRAMMVNFKAGDWKQGGSTISQQVARSLFLTRHKTIVRKVKEMILASTMEKHLTKEEILYLYLNQVYLGHGAYGIEAASHIYFGKKTENLTLAEAAILAGLPQSPSHYTPYHHPQKAKGRQIYVLKRMQDEGFITDEQRRKAILQELKIQNDSEFDAAPYFAEHVRKYLMSQYPKIDYLTSGLKIYTTLHSRFQKAAQTHLREGLREVDKRRGFRGVLKHIEKEQVTSYLKEQHKNLVYNKYFTRDLVPLENGNFGFYLDPQLYEEDTPLDVNQIYDGVVTKVDDEKEFIEVHIGTRLGRIALNNLQWASPVNAEVYWESRVLKKPSDAFAEGNILSVKIISILPAQEIELSLEQEPEVQGAVLSLEQGTGKVLSMVGGYDFTKSEFNRAHQAYRQVGSTFKPVIYSAALDKGYTSATMITDAPIIYQDKKNDHKWRPDNYGEKFYGDTLFRTALIKSRNIPTIKIVQDVGVEYVLAYSKKLGITSTMNEDLSSALGSSSASLWEMTRAYSVFANGGKLVEPIFIEKIADRDGKVIEQFKEPLVQRKIEVKVDFDQRREFASVEDKKNAEVKAQELRKFLKQFDASLQENQAISPETAFVTTNLLEAVVQEGTGWRLKELNRPVAGKTGTTDNYEDAWFIGYTPDVVTGVWVGMDDKSKAIGKFETGSSAAAPIWTNYMKEVLENYPKKEFVAPQGITFLKIDPETGLLAQPQAKNGVYAAFKQGTEPSEVEEQKEDIVIEEDNAQEKKTTDETLRGF